MKTENTPTTESVTAPAEKAKHLQETKPIKWQVQNINPNAPYQSGHPSSMNHFNYDEAGISEESKGEENESENEENQSGTSAGENTDKKTDKEPSDGSEDKSDEKTEDKPKNMEETRSERLSKTLNEIAKQQSELRKERKSLEEQRQKISSSSLDELREKASKNPLEAIEALGLDYNKITEFVLNGSGEESLSKKQESRIAMLERKLTERDELETTEQHRSKINQFKENIKNELSSQTDKYELINTGEEYETVYEVILQCHQETGKMLTLDEAADLVENNLETNLQAQLEKLSKTQKAKKWGFIKEKESVQADSVSSDKVTPEQDHAMEIAKNFVRSGQTPKTITGQMVGQSTTVRKRALTREEAIANAARMIDSAKTN